MSKSHSYPVTEAGLKPRQTDLKPVPDLLLPHREQRLEFKPFFLSPGSSPLLYLYTVSGRAKQHMASAGETCQKPRPFISGTEAEKHNEGGVLPGPKARLLAPALSITDSY